MPTKQLKLGEILINEGLITDKQLQEALTAQASDTQRNPIGETLIKMGFISEESLALALSKKLNVPYLSIQPGTIKIAKDMGFQKLVPEDFARQHNILPYNKTPDKIQVALSDPLDVMAIDNLRMMTHLEIAPSIATLSDIKRGIDELYGKEDAFKKAVQRVEAASGPAAGVLSPISLKSAWRWKS